MTTTTNLENPTELKPATGPKKKWLPYNPCGSACRTWVVLVLVILLAIFTGIFWQRQATINKKIDVQLHAFHRQHISVQGSIEDMQHQAESQAKTIAQLKLKLARLTAPQQWQHSEQVLHVVDFLLQQADLQLKLSQQPNTTLELLRQARKRLQSLANPDLLALIIAISHDITQLQQLPSVDADRLFARLTDLQQSITSLSFSPTLIAATSTNSTEKIQENDKTGNQTWYQRTWQGVKQQISKRIIVSHSDTEKPTLPLLSEQERDLVRLQIRGSIEMAKWALLQKNQAIYQQALQQMEQNLVSYYPQQPILNEITAKIKELKAENITPHLPDIEGSKQALAASLTHLEMLLTQSNSGISEQPAQQPKITPPKNDSPDEKPNTEPHEDKPKLPKTKGVEI